jgi:hypothetical protein
MENVWVELKGDIIVARLRGIPTRYLIKKCQDFIFQIAKDSSFYRVFYNDLSAAVSWLHGEQ